ncbi:MAG: riboflavin synthase [Weeksellaceae bacterium]|nr:riboflavin synthase [Weeksellaceae bacterium]
MFTGIIETLGEIKEISYSGNNIIFKIQSNFTKELQVDQSVAHDGVCLTVTSIQDAIYSVTAVRETLEKTRLGGWKTGDLVNLERSLQPSSRIDGHFVQGHVDTVGRVTSIVDDNGSWLYTIGYEGFENLIVPRGSICMNGISLTVAHSKPGQFTVAVIPYTYEHTNLQHCVVGDHVNLEFDIFGKYIVQYLNRMHDSQ